MVVTVPPIRKSLGWKPAEPIPSSYPGEFFVPAGVLRWEDTPDTRSFEGTSTHPFISLQSRTGPGDQSRDMTMNERVLRAVQRSRRSVQVRSCNHVRRLPLVHTTNSFPPVFSYIRYAPSGFQNARVFIQLAIFAHYQRVSISARTISYSCRVLRSHWGASPAV